MGGPKWLPRASGAGPAKKKQKKNTDKRATLKKDPGLPNFGRYAPPSKRKEKPVLISAGRVETVEEEEVTGGAAEMAALMLNARKRETEFQSREALMKTSEKEQMKADGVRLLGVKRGQQRDSSCRSYYKEFRKVVEASDILLEVLDARDPLGCRCLDIERTIMSEFCGKKTIVLVLNKLDLIPREIAHQWMARLREEMQVVPFTCMKTEITAGCVQYVRKVLNNIGGRKRITVGVIGYPNTGKSSVINALNRTNVVAVGNTPGFTKIASEVQLSSSIRIMDCPGIIFSTEVNDDIILRNAIKVEQLEDPITPVGLILERCPHKTLCDLYNLEPFAGLNEFLGGVARKKGKLGPRGEPALEMAARIVLQDWNGGKIPFYTVPVTRDDAIGDPTVLRSVEDPDFETHVLQQLPPLASVQQLFAPITTSKFGTTTEPMWLKKKGRKRAREDDEEGDEDDEEEFEEEEEGVAMKEGE